jgi:hypothetical protein
LQAAISIHAKQGKTISVIPAQAGIHSEVIGAIGLWIPACAGMTEGCVAPQIIFTHGITEHINKNRRQVSNGND